MRVNPANSAPVQNSESAAAKKSEKLKSNAYDNKSAAANSVKTDSAKAEISSKAKDMAKAKQLASDTPDVREEKIAALKAQIQNKTYKVGADKIADKLVDDHVKFVGA